MRTQIRVVRGLLAGVGVMTIVLSSITVVGAVKQLRALESDALSQVSLVSLALGVVLAVLGCCLVVRGARYESRTETGQSA